MSREELNIFIERTMLGLELFLFGCVGLMAIAYFCK